MVFLIFNERTSNLSNLMIKKLDQGKLRFQNGLEFEGRSFGFFNSVAGEVVFSTGMVGYPESLTDPSYKGQILIFTYPLIGNYGVFNKKYWESEGIKVSGVIVSSYIGTPSHYQSTMSLGKWLKQEKIPGLEVKDTRRLTQLIRKKGTMLGRIELKGKVEFEDPNIRNLVAEVSTSKVIKYGRGKKKVVLIDCGVKRNIINSLVKRGVQVIRVPWNYDVSQLNQIDGVVISNGPGDPKMNIKTITVKPSKIIIMVDFLILICIKI